MIFNYGSCLRNPSRHAICPGTQSVSPHPGGDRRPDRAGGNGAANRRHGTVPGNCPARSLVPPNGAAQNRLAKARLKTGGGPAARRPDRAGGMVPPDRAARRMVPPIGGTEYGAARHGAANRRHGVRCRPMGRHGVWCRLLAARFLAARFWAAGNSPPIGGPCWPGGRRGQIGIGDSPAWMRSLGMRSLGMRSLGMRSLGMRMSWNADVRGCGCPGMWVSGDVEPGGNAESGDCPPARLGRRERCRPIGRHRMVPPIGGTCRRLEWCRQSAARSTVPPNGAARGMVPPIGGTVPGGAVLGSREQSADWRTVLAGRQTGADRNWGFPGLDAEFGNAEFGNAEPGNAEPGNADVLECGCPGMRVSGDVGVRGCGAWGKCGVRGLPAGPIGPAGAVPPDRAAQNGAAYWRHLPPPGMVPPIGGTVCGAALLGGTVPAAASRAAGRSAGGRRGGGGVARLLREPRKDAWGRPGVLPSCGTAGAARPAWCRLGMVPPGYGAAYWRHGSWRRGSWRHGVAGRMRAGLHGACNWRRGSLAARFPGLCGAGRGGMSKNSLLAWMTRAGAGSVWRNGVWGMGERGRGNGIGGTASGCWGLPGWRRGSGGCRGRRVWWRPLENGAWKNRVWKNGAGGCGVGVRGT